MKDLIFNEFKKINWEKLKNYQKPILGGFLGAGLILSYFFYKDYFPSTDNAYVNANIINMIPKVSGYITHIYVHNNQYVKKGDVLLEIDQKDYQLLLNQAKLDFKLAKKSSNISKKKIFRKQTPILLKQKPIMNIHCKCEIDIRLCINNMPAPKRRSKNLQMISNKPSKL